MRTFSQRGGVRRQLVLMLEKSVSEHWRSESVRRLVCIKYSAATGFGGFWGLGWNYEGPVNVFVLKIQNEIFFKKCLKSFACSWETSWCRVVSKLVVNPQSFCFSPCPEFLFISWFFLQMGFISMAISIFGNRKLREFWDRGKPLVRSALAEDALFDVYLGFKKILLSWFHLSPEASPCSLPINIAVKNVCFAVKTLASWVCVLSSIDRRRWAFRISLSLILQRLIEAFRIVLSSLSMILDVLQLYLEVI